MTLKLSLAFVLAFIIALIVGKFYIPWLRRIKAGQEIKEIEIGRASCRERV